MICVDASVVVKWLVPEEHSDQARAARSAASDAAEMVIAPNLLIFEVSNVLLKMTRRPDPISVESAVTLLGNLLDTEIQLRDPSPLHQPALDFAISYGLPAVYDAYYLALAADANCPFWTADQRLLHTLNGRLPFVHWIGDFPI